MNGLDSPQAAEAAFYEAFETADHAAMRRVWAEEETIECVHPGGPRLQGRAAVHASWERILGAGPGLRFRLTEVQRIEGESLAIHILHERITVAGESGERPPVVATNVYRRTSDGWRMVLHHASPTPGQAPQEPEDAGGEQLH